ncbi:MAG: hypothetical protein QOI34_1615 [Verrucomicrobiota bacterium]
MISQTIYMTAPNPFRDRTFLMSASGRVPINSSLGPFVCPTQLGRRRPQVRISFHDARTNDFVGNFRIKLFSFAGSEGFLYPAIFAGMKGENGDAPAGP